jgi:ABC-type protease/lipase transport system fused ATPase/permease subunit
VRIVTAIIVVILLFQSFYMLALSTREGFSVITLVALGVALAPLLVLLLVYFLARRRPTGTRILVISGAIIFRVYAEACGSILTGNKYNSL